jgi:aminoglycoside phosphotransferase (APT) family kinase protein
MASSGTRARKVIGTGLTSEVLDWEEGRVCKLYRPGYPRDKVEREWRATRAIHGAGLPVPEVFEIVESDGRLGFVMERIVGTSMLEHVQRRPWQFLQAVRELAELHAQVHRCQAPAGLPTLHDQVAERLAQAHHLSDAEKQRAQQQLTRLPKGDALCHGDFHPQNVLWTARGPVLLDWETASRGDPLGDVACTCRLMRRASLPPRSPLHTQAILLFARGIIERTYVQRYLELRPGSPAAISAWQAALDVAMDVGATNVGALDVAANGSRA